MNVLRLPCVISEWTFQAIFPVKLSTQRLHLHGDLDNEHEESSPVSIRNCLFKTIFRKKLSYQPTEALSPKRPQQQMSRVYLHSLVFQIMPLLTLLPKYSCQNATICQTATVLKQQKTQHLCQQPLHTLLPNICQNIYTP